VRSHQGGRKAVNDDKKSNIPASGTMYRGARAAQRDTLNLTVTMKKENRDDE
jgi:hypothetical protein